MITYKHAKTYLDKGWSVFPVILSKAKDGKIIKRPAVAWKEYQTRKPTDKELHNWFDDGQYNAIGLATGKVSNVVVVDVDSKKKPDFRELNSSFIVNTISGGWHYYYKWTHEMRNATKIDGKDMDFRADGGYTVLPPSQLGDSKYKWNKTVSDLMYLEELPKELEKKLTIKKSTPRGLNAKSTGNFPAIGIGERNDTASRVAGSIIKNLPRKYVGYGWPILKEWNTSNSPPMEEQELRKVWESISSTDVRNNPTKINGDYQVLTGSKVMEKYNNDKSKYEKGLSTGYDWLDKYFTFLPEQLYLLSAPTHQGKTTLALNIGARMASMGKRVLFASFEQGVFIAGRVEGIVGGKFPETLSFLTSNEMATPRGLEDLINSLDKKPELLIIDHLHFMKLQGEATEAIDRMIIDLQNMAKRLEMPIFVITHVRKLNADRPPELDDLRNSSSLSQVPSVVMFLYRKRRDVDSTSDSYLENKGMLIIAKNRIQGKTGFIPVQLGTLGEVTKWEN